MEDFLTALALLFIIEGVLPFCNPAGVRRTLRSISEYDDKVLRFVGLISMLFGLLFLYFIR